jgi:hypothetical protein
LLRVDFNPTNQAVAPDTGRSMQIISADAEETVRLFQFRMVWSSVNDLTPEIIFINIGNPIQSLAAVLPTTGSNALSTSNWFTWRRPTMASPTPPATSNSSGPKWKPTARAPICWRVCA